MTTFFVSIENGVGADLTEFTLLDTVLFGEVYVGSDGLVIKLKLVTSDPVGYFLHVFQAICFVYLLFDGHAFGKNCIQNSSIIRRQPLSVYTPRVGGYSGN